MAAKSRKKIFFFQLIARAIINGTLFRNNPRLLRNKARLLFNNPGLLGNTLGVIFIPFGEIFFLFGENNFSFGVFYHDTTIFLIVSITHADNIQALNGPHQWRHSRFQKFKSTCDSTALSISSGRLQKKSMPVRLSSSSMLMAYVA